jgi:hypothetical protein
MFLFHKIHSSGIKTYICRYSKIAEILVVDDILTTNTSTISDANSEKRIVGSGSNLTSTACPMAVRVNQVISWH